MKIRALAAAACMELGKVDVTAALGTRSRAARPRA
jgi:hypothetical protein